MDTRAAPLTGKTALITGSTGGIGHAMALALARAGCNILLHGFEEPEEAMRPVAARLAREHGVAVQYLRADLSDPQAVGAMMDVALAAHGGIDVLVNNAVTRDFAPIESFPVDAWDRALSVNLSAAFHAIRLSLPGMRKRGWGRIVNMTSVYGVRGIANRIGYATTKAALDGMTRAVAVETINDGITCNALCPGSVLTPSIDQRLQAVMREHDLDREAATRQFLAGKQPTLRFVEPEHVAELLVFLCGPAGRDITGAVLPVEGGWLAS